MPSNSFDQLWNRDGGSRSNLPEGLGSLLTYERRRVVDKRIFEIGDATSGCGTYRPQCSCRVPSDGGIWTFDEQLDDCRSRSRGIFPKYAASDQALNLPLMACSETKPVPVLLLQKRHKVSPNLRITTAKLMNQIGHRAGANLLESPVCPAIGLEV